MERKILGQDELNAAIQTLEGWVADGSILKKRFTFENFSESLEFVNSVGALAEAADHHPDISFGWGYAELALTTHDRGGITDLDIALASQVDRLS